MKITKQDIKQELLYIMLFIQNKISEKHLKFLLKTQKKSIIK